MEDNDTIYMLTTLDNPYNPFIQYKEWYSFDVLMGYNTCSYLARIAKTSNDLSIEDEVLEIQSAIDDIIRLNITGNYIKVSKENFRDRTKDIK